MPAKFSLHFDHAWDVTLQEAITIQQRLRRHVITHDTFPPIHTVAGVDAGFEDNGTVTRAAVAVLDFPSLETIETAVIRQPTTFPYVPGLLSFREVPALLTALSRLNTVPNIILCDGQGIAHPRRFGLACHFQRFDSLRTSRQEWQ